MKFTFMTAFVIPMLFILICAVFVLLFAAFSLRGRNIPIARRLSLMMTKLANRYAEVLGDGDRHSEESPNAVGRSVGRPPPQGRET